jgi:hypothetical protein
MRARRYRVRTDVVHQVHADHDSIGTEAKCSVSLTPWVVPAGVAWLAGTLIAAQTTSTFGTGRLPTNVLTVDPSGEIARIAELPVGDVHGAVGRHDDAVWYIELRLGDRIAVNIPGETILSGIARHHGRILRKDRSWR